MKKIVLPLFVVLTSLFSSIGNANENLSATDILTQIKSIQCDYGGSQATYNLTSKKYTYFGRTKDDVYPIIGTKADDEKKTITISVDKLGRVTEQVFKIKGLPYNVGFDNTTRINIEVQYAECMGYL